MTAAAAAIALLSVFARDGVQTSSPQVTPPSDQPGFVPGAVLAARPVLAASSAGGRFALDDPDALEPVRAELARRNPATGQREEVLEQGRFSGLDAPYLRLTLTEAGADAAPRSLFVQMVRRAADGLGLAVTRTGERGRLVTKFGAVETLELTLSGEGARTCTGFATVEPGTQRVDGWLCAPLAQAPEPRAIRCALDRIVPNGSASPEIDGAFRAYEAKRDPSCAGGIAMAREATGTTGSIGERRTRKNEAKLRRNAQARP